MKSHLASRGLQLERYSGISLNRWTTSFRLYTPTGKCVGYHQYRPTADKTRKNNPKFGRYYTHVTHGFLPIWGFETLHYRDDIVFAAEGVFKACRLHNFELPAVSLCGNDAKIFMNQMHMLGRKVIAICDPDEAGRKLAKVGHESYDMDGRYLDQVTDEEIADFLKKLGI